MTISIRSLLGRIPSRLGCSLLALLSLNAKGVAAQPTRTKLPIVRYAEVPFYPFNAWAGGVSGSVIANISTDGKRAIKITIVSGPPMLVDSVRENIKTWRFKPHQPTKFEVVFDYKRSADTQIEPGNDVVILHLPSRVEIVAKRIQTSDPILSH